MVTAMYISRMPRGAGSVGADPISATKNYVRTCRIHNVPLVKHQLSIGLLLFESEVFERCSTGVSVGIVMWVSVRNRKRRSGNLAAAPRFAPSEASFQAATPQPPPICIAVSILPLPVSSNVGGVLYVTYSSRIQLPTDTPPQLIPFVRLPIFVLSRRGLSRTEMGLAPAFVELRPFENWSGRRRLSLLLSPLLSIPTATGGTPLALASCN